MFRIICLVIGYAIGCFQTAYIVGRNFGKIDIREHGSGGAGMTNVLRVMGAKAGLVVFVCDMLKSVIGYCVCSLIFGGAGSFLAGDGGLGYLPGLYGALGVILGHNFPFYINFKGGKGIAAMIGLILCFDFRVVLVIAVIALPAIFITKYISVASLLLSLLLPICMIIFKFPAEVVGLGFVLMALAYYQHRSNIGRLINGNENKFSIKKKI